MATHGNSNKNDNPHHLYVVLDLEENDIYKYGISHMDIEEDGISSRVRDQWLEFNRIVNSERFEVQILVLDIPGKLAARKLERQYIRAYREKHGRRPRGNLMD